MLIYMFSLSLVLSLPISLCSVAGCSVREGDSAGTGAWRAAEHLLRRTVRCWGGVMGRSAHCTCMDTKHRAERTPVVLLGGGWHSHREVAQP